MITIKQFLVRMYYLLKQKMSGITFPQNLQVITPVETLNTIVTFINNKKTGAYLRFGDGEINIAEGKGAIEQKPDQKLAQEMREALMLKSETIMKSLMIHSKRFGWSKGMEPGMHLTDDAWAEQLLFRSYTYFSATPIYSHAAFAYCAVFEPETFIRTVLVIRSQSVIFIGNETIPETLIKKLFGINTTIIGTSPKSTYNSIDTINQKIVSAAEQNNNSFKILIYAAGPSSNVLQKRSLQRNDNVFSIDIGSLADAFSGNVSRAWIDQVPGGKTYWQQLLAKI